MATPTRFLRLTALAAAFAAGGAWGMGDRPPEGAEKAQQQAPAACQEPRPGTAGGSAQAPGGGGGTSCDPAAKAGDASNPDNKSRASRPGRFGTGFEARQGLGAGGRGHGRGR